MLIKDPGDVPIPRNRIPDIVRLVGNARDEYEKCQQDGTLHKNCLQYSSTLDGRKFRRFDIDLKRE